MTGYNFHINLKISVIANSEDPDEMLHYRAFHLGLHCLPKNAFGGHEHIERTYLMGCLHSMNFGFSVSSVVQFH